LLATGTSWLATTAWVVLGTGTLVAVDIGGMVRDLLLLLILPVACGQALRSVPVLARWTVRWRVLLGVVSQLLVFSVILKAAVEVFERLRQDDAAPLRWSDGVLVAILCLGIHLGAFAGGFWSSKGLCFDRPSQIAVAFSCSQKTLPVALLLFEYFKEKYPLAVVPMVLYHVEQLLVDTFLADVLAARNCDEVLSDV